MNIIMIIIIMMIVIMIIKIIILIIMIIITITTVNNDSDTNSSSLGECMFVCIIPCFQSLTSPVSSLVSDLQLFRTASPFNRRTMAIEWHPTNPNLLVAGSKAGDIILSVLYVLFPVSRVWRRLWAAWYLTCSCSGRQVRLTCVRPPWSGTPTSWWWAPMLGTSSCLYYMYYSLFPESDVACEQPGIWPAALPDGKSV